MDEEHEKKDTEIASITDNKTSDVTNSITDNKTSDMTNNITDSKTSDMTNNITDSKTSDMTNNITDNKTSDMTNNIVDDTTDDTTKDIIDDKINKMIFNKTNKMIFNKTNKMIFNKTNKMKNNKIDNKKESDINNRNILNNRENIKRSNDGIITLEKNSRLYVILGWISAALTVFISPIFAIAGITFGILLNGQTKASGNIIIITNVVLAFFIIGLQLIYLLMLI